MRSLQQENTFVIKPANKGGAIVIMDRDFYVAENKSHLFDRTTLDLAP